LNSTETFVPQGPKPAQYLGSDKRRVLSPCVTLNVQNSVLIYTLQVHCSAEAYTLLPH